MWKGCEISLEHLGPCRSKFRPYLPQTPFHPYLYKCYATIVAWSVHKKPKEPINRSEEDADPGGVGDHALASYDFSA